MFIDVQKVTTDEVFAKYALLKVRYFSAQRALNFLYHQDDSGLYEHTFIAISSREDFLKHDEESLAPIFELHNENLHAHN